MINDGLPGYGRIIKIVHHQSTATHCRGQASGLYPDIYPCMNPVVSPRSVQAGRDNRQKDVGWYSLRCCRLPSPYMCVIYSIGPISFGQRWFNKPANLSIPHLSISCLPFHILHTAIFEGRTHQTRPYFAGEFTPFGAAARPDIFGSLPFPVQQGNLRRGNIPLND